MNWKGMVLPFMICIQHYLKDAKLWELWYMGNAGFISSTVRGLVLQTPCALAVIPSAVWGFNRDV